MKNVFRQEFDFSKNFKLNWYPGHMAKTYRKLPENFKKVDMFLEIRDSRIPLSSSNTELDKIIPSHIKRYILFNKYDLCDQTKTTKIVEKYFNENPKLKANIKYMFMSAKTDINIKKILEMIIRDNNPKYKTIGTWCMIGGIPNVGKSTLINVFRGMSSDIKALSEQTTKHATTGAIATTTRRMDCFKINLDPVIFIMDTPGIMPPKLYNNKSALKLSICGNIKDKIAGKDLICDYLLYSLNKNQNSIDGYMKAFRMKEPTDSLYEFLKHLMEEFKIPNSNNAYDFMLRYFRDGKIGKFTFDDNIEKDLIIK